MKKLILAIALISLFSCSGKDAKNDPVIVPDEKPEIKIEPGTRNPLTWPFAQNSIWNMPIGAKAVYVHAKLEKATQQGMTIDEDYIVMTPDETLVDIYENFAGWDRNKSRCEKQGKLLFSAPIPKSFLVSPTYKPSFDGSSANIKNVRHVNYRPFNFSMLST